MRGGGILNEIVGIVLLSGISGMAAPMLGAAVSLLIGPERRRLISFIMEFSAGLMIGIAAYDLLPEALHAGYPPALSGLTLGAVLALCLKGVVERHGEGRTLLSTGALQLIGVCAHNFFEGLAIGSGFLLSPQLGLSLLLVIVLHDLPEGVGLGAPLRGAKVRPFRILLLAAATGLPVLLGTAAGALAGGISPELTGFCLALAAGVMLYISFSDVIPSSRRLVTSRGQGALNIAGMAAGLLLSKICI